MKKYVGSVLIVLAIAHFLLFLIIIFLRIANLLNIPSDLILILYFSAWIYSIIKLKSWHIALGFLLNLVLIVILSFIISDLFYYFFPIIDFLLKLLTLSNSNL